VIATADHGHSSQIVENVSEDDLRSAAEEAKLPIERVRDLMYPGLTLKLTTADSAEMTVSYGTSSDVAAEDEPTRARRCASPHSVRARPMSSASPIRRICSSK
jgi:hypothetical protein